MLLRILFVVVSTLSFYQCAAHSGHEHPSLVSILNRAAAANPSTSSFSASKFPAIQSILEGNTRFISTTRNATLMTDLVENGQKPPVMMVSCSDSRAPEATIFDSQPGTFFMERNIANQYKPGDENAQSVMAYGITVLGVQHVVVMGHYGCGGIAASIASAPKASISVASHIVQTWIGDVRSLYLSSNRTEIVELRTRNLATEAEGGTVAEPDIRDPGFRALVEENVKQQVTRISLSSVITNLNEEVTTSLNPDGTPKSPNNNETPAEGEEEATLKPVFVHGWVHDLETGEVIDLNISTGPAGFENFVPPSSQPESPSEAEPSSSTTAVLESTSIPESTLAPESTPAPETSSGLPQVEEVVVPSTESTSGVVGNAERQDVKVHGTGVQEAPNPTKRNTPTKKRSLRNSRSRARRSRR